MLLILEKGFQNSFAIVFLFIDVSAEIPLI